MGDASLGQYRPVCTETADVWIRPSRGGFEDDAHLGLVIFLRKSEQIISVRYLSIMPLDRTECLLSGKSMSCFEQRT